MEETASRLTKLWNAEKWPKLRKKKLIAKNSKKGNLLDCKNWRELTKIGVGKKLRKEQAGFRPKRSTTEHVFVLRHSRKSKEQHCTR